VCFAKKENQLVDVCLVEKSPSITETFKIILTEKAFQADIDRWMDLADFTLHVRLWHIAPTSWSNGFESQYLEDTGSLCPPSFDELLGIDRHIRDQSHP
jgi:hypothetical protein